MSKRSVQERLLDFDEVEQGLGAHSAVLEALRCMECLRPKCIEGCPVNIDIPGFINAVAREDFRQAAKIIREENMLPAICGRVCPQENQCEGACILGNKEKPIRIGDLERFIADWEREEGILLPEVKEATHKRIAVVGSGPAGITAASELARAGHDVTIFESLHEAGGVLTYGIPAFRMPKDIVAAEISQVCALGAEIRLNHVVGRSIDAEELLGYDAIFIGTGAGLPFFLGIEGENLNGVYSANEFLTRVNLMHSDKFPEFDTPIIRGSRVVVIGGGNVAMDAARVARRMGGRVSLIYRRRQEDLPARQPEVENAIEEGVEMVCCANPLRILGGPSVSGIECVRMEVCGTGSDERAVTRPCTGEENHFVLVADVVIVAIGQGPNPLLAGLIPGLKRGPKGTILTDEDGRTSIPHVFAGGDIATGAATVIWAMGSAKNAAASINRMLSDKN